MTALDKLAAAKPQMRSISEFIDWLEVEHRIVLARFHLHSPCCFARGVEPIPANGARTYELPKHSKKRKYIDEATIECGSTERTLEPVCQMFESLLANYFGIDQAKIEDERREILRTMR